MKAIVTGGCGFIGSHIAQELCESGHEVIIIDDLSSGKMSNINKLPAKFIEADIVTFNSKIKNVDVIFHNAASKKNICLSDPMRDLEVNGGGTLNMLRFAKTHGVKKFIHASTGSVYGDRDYKLREGIIPEPVSYYGVSKNAGEGYVNIFKKHFHTTILRYFHVYGKRQDHSEDKGGVVAIFANRLKNNQPLSIFGTGYQKRSFTYVKDVVKANMLALENQGTYNIASGICVTLWDLIRELESALGKKGTYEMFEAVEGDIYNFIINNTLIKKAGLKFTSFTDGIRMTV